MSGAYLNVHFQEKPPEHQDMRWGVAMWVDIRSLALGMEREANHVLQKWDGHFSEWRQVHPQGNSFLRRVRSCPPCHEVAMDPPDTFCFEGENHLLQLATWNTPKRHSHDISDVLVSYYIN